MVISSAAMLLNSLPRVDNFKQLSSERPEGVLGACLVEPTNTQFQAGMLSCTDSDRFVGMFIGAQKERAVWILLSPKGFAGTDWPGLSLTCCKRLKSDVTRESLQTWVGAKHKPKHSKFCALRIAHCFEPGIVEALLVLVVRVCMLSCVRACWCAYAWKDD
eukprot:6485202-Amphidinium_carterae.1